MLVRPHLHGLLLRLFPDHPADPGPRRENQAAAEFDLGIGAARRRADRRAGAAAARARRLRRTRHGHYARNPRSRRRARRARRARAAAGARRADAAEAQMVVLGTVRQIRPRPAPARLQGLSRSLPGLPRHAAAVVPQSRRAGRTRLYDRAGRGDRGRIPGPGRARRPGRGQATAPAGSPTASRRRSPTSRRRARATTPCRPTCR